MPHVTSKDYKLGPLALGYTAQTTVLPGTKFYWLRSGYHKGFRNIRGIGVRTHGRRFQAWCW